MKHKPSPSAPSAPAAPALTAEDMTDPLIRAFLAKKQLQADIAQILSFASKVRGRTFDSVSALVADLQPQTVVRPGELSPVQVAQALSLATTTMSQTAIASQIGCPTYRIKALFAKHAVRPTRPRASPLTDAQMNLLRQLGTSPKSAKKISVEVGCTYDQATAFFRREPRKP